MKRYLILCVLLCGIVLRWYAIDWSLPHIFHPDETRLLYAVHEISLEDLNPHFFAYGSLPIYLLKITQVSVEGMLKALGKPPHVNFFFMGRAVSAFFGSLTLLVLYLTGKRFFSQRVGLLATTFLAFTVLHIQLSHFLTVDVMMTFFVVLAMYCLLSLGSPASLLAERAGWKPAIHNYVSSGICLGLALATKISALPLYGILLAAHVFACFNRKKWTSLRLWGGLFLALLLSIATFFLCEPYAFLDFEEFYRQVKEQSDMVRGVIQPPYVIQYEHTTPYVYQLKQLVLYSMGIPLGVLTLLGSVCTSARTFQRIPLLFSRWHNEERQRIQSLLLILVWVIPVFVIVGGFKVKFLRYMLPLIPFFCLSGAVCVEHLLTRSRSWKIAISIVTALTIAFSALYSVAFLSVYAREDPRIQASRWIYDNIEPGSILLTEAWEFAPLVPVDGGSPGQYAVRQISLYDPDTDEKAMQIVRHLAESDVIVLATRRLYGSILRVPDRFPLTSAYYKLLFDGELGFEPVGVFTQYPSLFGITFNDDFADESFSVYDHPKTILFRKTENLSADTLFTKIILEPPFDTDALLRRLQAFPACEADKRQCIKSQNEEEQTASPPLQGTHSQWGSVVIWLFTVELLACIAFPFVCVTFRKLPDMGFAVSKAFGILLPSFLVWLVVSVKLFSLSRGLIAGMIAALFLFSLFLTWRFQDFFQDVVLKKWRIFLISEMLFLLAFLAFLLFRAYNPDIFWSESSMDFSFLNVLVRTKTLPPTDPWISGFPLNYYYFGHYIVAMLTRLTATAPQIAYNLAFALFPALVILEVFSLLYNVTKKYLSGVIGVVFACIIGNLDGFFLLVANWREHFHWLDALLQQSKLFDNLIGNDPFYRFFRPAHEVIPYTVHEFPMWTFIFVDLHAHLLNMPFLIAAFLVGLNILSERNHTDILPVGFGNPTGATPYRTGNVPPSYAQERHSLSVYPPLTPPRGEIYASSPRTNSPPGRDRGWVTKKRNFCCLSVYLTALAVFLYTLLIGTLGVISSWDYPTAVIFLLLICVIQTYRNFKLPGTGFRRVRWLVLFIGIVIPGSFLLYAPFYASFSRSGMGIGLVGSSVTYIFDFLTIFGFFIFLILSYFLVQAARLHEKGHPWLTALAFVVLTYVSFAGISLWTGYDYSTLFFALFVMLTGTYLFLKTYTARQHTYVRIHEEHYETLYIWLCLFYACCIVIGCELIFVRDFLQGGDYKRMNTIFKFYIPAWFLFSFAATDSFSRIFSGIRRLQGHSYSGISRRLSFPFLLSMFWVVCFGLLFLASLVFPVMGMYARRHHRDVYNRTYLPPTLDGLAYIRAQDPAEYKAIQWLNEEVAGTPVILEATGADYLYEYARISANTGLPTVLGWRSHAEQREHWEHAHQRVDDIRTIYASENIMQVLHLLRRYHVEYIYIGRTERKDFPAPALQKFQHYPEHFEQVFSLGEVVMYRVR